jgi:hypothetical protein
MTLGLSTFCHDTDQPALDWTPAMGGVHDAGTNVGGPGQVGRSWSARLSNDSAPATAIDLITFVTEVAGEYRVHLLAQWMTWDPGTCEVTWSAARAWDMRDPWPTREAAAFVASECAWGMTSQYGHLVMALGQFSHETFSPVLGWDGQPFEQEGDGR